MYSLDTRKIAISCYLKVKSYRKTETLLGISKSTLQNWVTKYMDNQTLNLSKRKRIGKVSDDVKTYIFSHVKNNPFTTIMELKKLVISKFSIKISSSTIFNILKSLNLSRKKITKKLYNKSIHEKNTKINEFKKTIKNIDKNQIISIDETYFYQEMYFNYGRCLKKDRLFTNHKTNQKKYSVIMATSNNKIIHFKIFEGNVNSDRYILFLKEFINKYKQKYLLMDNVRFHKTKKVVSLVKESKNKIIYTPPYSPEYNPIEEVFSKIKNSYKKIDDDKSFEEKLKISCDSITKENLSKYFDHSF